MNLFIIIIAKNIEIYRLEIKHVVFGLLWGDGKSKLVFVFRKLNVCLHLLDLGGKHLHKVQGSTK